MTVKRARGLARLQNTAALPCVDTGADIYYEGSISKCGDNADWDWGMYPDAHGHWVLMEADGPGCIFNFTQHRYPSSEVPVFRFYFDHSEEPQFTITPAEFGTKAPFLKPLADIFEGPEDNGIGPIWVVRSFVPMEFRSHCRVTSSIRLEGNTRALGQGGWGHITYQLYDSPEGLTTFSAEGPAPGSAPAGIPCEEVSGGSLCLLPGESRQVLHLSGEGCLGEIRLETEGFSPEMLGKLWISITFDGAAKPQVEAPLGTFFGCECVSGSRSLETCLLTQRIRGAQAQFFNRFPMPFWEGAQVVLENRMESAAELTLRFGATRRLRYDRSTTGTFTASPYYGERENLRGCNSVIGEMKGCGQFAYGVMTGRGIFCDCEGDVRVFIDGSRSPNVESDGSESWACYGWGFAVPPQCNPFSAYDSLREAPTLWSMVRLTLGDSYPFRSELRFELEHGCFNDGGGSHSGQIFAYLLPPKEVFLCRLAPGDGGYCTDGRAEKMINRFENGIHQSYMPFQCVRGMTKTTLTFDLPPENAGVVLKRVSLQDPGRMAADVYADGQRVTQRQWLYPDSNAIYSLLSDRFVIPAAYTAGKSRMRVTIVPRDENWTECEYALFAVTE